MHAKTIRFFYFCAVAITLTTALPADEFYTSPGGGCRDALIQAIDTAQTEILVFAYSITSKPIADALCRATSRGISVGVIADRLQSSGSRSKTRQLSEGCTRFGLGNCRGSMHAKTVIIDRQTVFSGSYNFTDAAEHANTEHLWRVDSPELATRAAQHWQTLAEKAFPLPNSKASQPARPECPACTRNPHPISFRQRNLKW